MYRDAPAIPREARTFRLHVASEDAHEPHDLSAEPVLSKLGRHHRDQPPARAVAPPQQRADTAGIDVVALKDTHSVCSPLPPGRRRDRKWAASYRTGGGAACRRPWNGVAGQAPTRGRLGLRAGRVDG